MTDSMIERVALKLLPKCAGFGKGDMPMAVAREFARDAIEGMREPTEDMICAGADQTGVEMKEARWTWNAMIDAALKEEAK